MTVFESKFGKTFKWCVKYNLNNDHNNYTDQYCGCKILKETKIKKETFQLIELDGETELHVFNESSTIVTVYSEIERNVKRDDIWRE